MMKKTEEQPKKKGMYLVATFGAAALIAVAALGIGLMNQGDKNEPGRIDLNATPTPGQQPKEIAKQDPVQQVTPVPTAEPKSDKQENTPETTEPKQQVAEITTPDTQQVAETTAPEDTAVLSPDGVIKGLNFSAETGMLWPITGEALIAYSPDHAIYHKTLDSYRTSDYVFLSGEVGTHVSAAADGVVTSVKEELRTGITVTMRVAEDYEITYGMLSDVTVKEGDFVDAGTVFATVAQPTRYFAEDGTGLYIQVLEKGEAVNPMLFLQ
ncbi:MAG: peptidoglycan DD-metalloendopeptidase family protein [Lachnospiraceae bacterium]|nr:peptidoglycan DD-metalloendopeptidase family protein [Lachnospiraceae bacterium]